MNGDYVSGETSDYESGSKSDYESGGKSAHKNAHKNVGRSGCTNEAMNGVELEQSDAATTAPSESRIVGQSDLNVKVHDAPSAMNELKVLSDSTLLVLSVLELNSYVTMGLHSYVITVQNS